MLKIIIDSKIPFINGVFEQFAETIYLETKNFSAENVISADILFIRSRTKCNAELLQNSTVKFIVSASIGHDHIDKDYCKKNGIKWSNARGCNSASVQQYINSVLFYLEEKFSLNLAQMTLGIVGLGNVGKKVESSAIALGMKILRNDPPREKRGQKGFSSFEKILNDADIITLHTPLIKTGKYKTQHLIDEKALNLLANRKKNVYLINSSRGGIIDNVSLEKALHKNGNKICVVLDVWENEPKINKKLLDSIELATPHIAGYSIQGKANATKIGVAKIAKFCKFTINNFQPDIPKPPNTFFYDEKKDLSENFRKLQKFSYNVIEDDKTLRNNSESFENQRNSYPIRHEIKNLKIKKIPSEEIKKAVKILIKKVSK